MNIAAVCRQLGYSKQAYYKSLQRKKVNNSNKAKVKQQVLAIRASMPRIGTRKLYYLLNESCHTGKLSIGRDALFDLLRKEGLLIAAKKRFTRTTDSRHWIGKYPNLAKDMKINHPEQLWVADITYIALKQGYCYLHLITDAYSKQIMGYHLSEGMPATATLKALQMALKSRKYNHPLTHHSDRGLQYCSSLYTNLLQQQDIAISMTQDGSPYDNAIAERMNGILKNEFGMDEIFENMEQALIQLRQAIHYYNNLRPHISNHLLTPYQMHLQNSLKPKTWNKRSTKTTQSSCASLS